MFRKIKKAYQRAARGYADEDIWSLDMYLAKWMPDALRQLKNQKHGIPIEFLDSTEEWDVIMDTMIAGFEAARDIQEFNFETNQECEVLLDIWQKGGTLFVKHFFSLWD